MKKTFIALLVLSFISIFFGNKAEAVFTTDIIRDIPFGEASGQTLYLNVIYPVGKPTPSPVVIWLHAGGFISGTKEEAEDGGAYDLAEAGYVVVPIDYRISPVAEFPAQIHDIRGAARFMRANSETYNIDPERIGVLGVSSGGYLAAFAAVTNDEPEYFGEVGGNLDQSNEIKTALNFYGSISTSHLDELASSKIERIEDLLWCGDDLFAPECAADLEEFTIENHANPGDAPIQTFHGTSDTSIPYSQSKYMTKALLQHGVSARLFLAPGYEHEMAIFVDYFNKVKRFLKQTL